MIVDLWIPFNPHSTISTAFQFATNIKGLNGAIKEWAVGKRVREDFELKSFETEISRILDSGVGGGMLSLASKEARTSLVGRRKDILLDREET